jgi:diguanylate cyclase (GGDEF)-like protein/PAS domain S-box-containing protein
VVHRDKGNIHLHVKNAPLIVKDEIVGVYCVAKDITELHHTKAVLFQMGERLQALFNSTGDAISILDMDGNVLDVNPAFEELYGWNREDVIGMPLPIIPQSDLTQYHMISEQVKAGEHLIGFEATCIKRDCTPIEVSITISPIRDTRGNVIGTSGITRDITKQKQLELSLKESEERYRLIAENMTDLVCMINWDGSFKYASPSHVTVLGYPSEAYEGKPARDWMHKDDHPRVRKQLEETVNTKEACVFEYRFRDIEGKWIWLEGKATSVFNEKGDFEHFLVVSRDITERRMYEEKLRHMAYHDSLTGLLNRRRFKERLEQSIKEAKRYGRKLAVMYLDLDKFKNVNDTFGHDVGDVLLREFSNRVRNHLRESDTIARQGGDEFTIILPVIQEERDALQVAERILDSLREPWVMDGNIFHTTSSIGIAFYPKDGTTRHELMKHADNALYKAKQNGRNNVKTYSLITVDDK